MVEIKAYHGTNAEFTAFKCPAYFAKECDTSIPFGEFSAGDKYYIYECLLAFENPLVVDLDGQSWGGFFLENEKLQKDCVNYVAEGDEEELAYFDEVGLSVGFLADYAEATGYDGIIAYNCHENSGIVDTQYVAFKASQIQILKKESYEKCYGNVKPKGKGR